MHHVAIMKKSWGLTDKILTGEKSIESRWYQTKRCPWDGIAKGDTVFFKNGGEPVKIKATVASVKQISLFNKQSVIDLLDQYGKRDGITPEQLPGFIEMFQNKKYCILVFLSNPETIVPFEINKKGFGMMSAWISVNDIQSIKLS